MIWSLKEFLILLYIWAPGFLNMENSLYKFARSTFDLLSFITNYCTPLKTALALALSEEESFSWLWNQICFDTRKLHILFMDDNARSHCSRAVPNFFRNCGITTFPCSARNPDLNPIVYVCDIIGCRFKRMDSLVHTLAHWRLLCTGNGNNALWILYGGFLRGWGGL